MLLVQKQSPLTNFVEFKGKHLCQSLFFNEVVGLSLKNFNTFSYRTPPVAATTCNTFDNLTYSSRSFVNLTNIIQHLPNLKHVPNILVCPDLPLYQ